MCFDVIVGCISLQFQLRGGAMKKEKLDKGMYAWIHLVGRHTFKALTSDGPFCAATFLAKIKNTKSNRKSSNFIHSQQRFIS